MCFQNSTMSVIHVTKVCVFFVLDTGCWSRPVGLTNLGQSDGSSVSSWFWLGFSFIFASSKEWNRQGRYVKPRWKPKTAGDTVEAKQCVFLFAGGVFHSIVPIPYPDCPVNKQCTASRSFRRNQILHSTPMGKLALGGGKKMTPSYANKCTNDRRWEWLTNVTLCCRCGWTLQLRSLIPSGLVLAP